MYTYTYTHTSVHDRNFPQERATTTTQNQTQHNTNQSADKWVHLRTCQSQRERERLQESQTINNECIPSFGKSSHTHTHTHAKPERKIHQYNWSTNALTSWVYNTSFRLTALPDLCRNYNRWQLFDYDDGSRWGGKGCCWTNKTE